jgi:hypothetical protein
MADRAFGVREINIVGSAGTPTISSPDNINLNGNNVAISTDLQVGRNASIVGVITANAYYGDGSNLTGVSGGGSVAGIDTAGTSTFNDLNVSGMTTLGTDVNIGDGVSYLQIYNGGQQILRPNGFLRIQAGGASGPRLELENNGGVLLIPASGDNTSLYHSGTNLKLNTKSTGVTVTGVLDATNVGAISSVTAANFYGDGSGLTNIPGGSTAGIDTATTSFFNTLHATGTIDIGTTNAGVAVTHMTIDTADVSGTIRNSIKSGAGNTNAVFDIETKEFLVTDPYAGKGALIAADSSGTKLFKDDSLKLQTIGTGVTVTGTMYATAFSGDGSGLTGVPISGTDGSFTRVDSQQIVISGLSTFQGNVYLGDNDVLNIGDTNDLQIWHTGSASVIRDAGTGELQLQSNGTAIRFSDTSGNKSALFNTNADTNLYYADALRLQTLGAGVTIFGTLETQQLRTSGISTFFITFASSDYALFGDNDHSDTPYWTIEGTQLKNYYAFGADLFAKSELKIGHPVNFTRTATFDTDNQRLGINTNSPGYTLDVHGQSYLREGLTVVGVVSATSNLHVATNLKLEGDGTDSFIKETSATGELTISTNQLKIENPSFETLARFNENADVQLYYDNNLKLSTTNTGVNISGITTSTSFTTNSTTGDGSDRGFTTKYYITADGSTSYRFAGPGVANTTANPTLYLHRGFTYIFENSTGSAHPFELRVSDGGAAWAPGNFLSGSINGTQVLTVPFDAQASIVYQCTLHSGMVGTINFVS